MLEKTNILEKFAHVPDYWNPRIVGELIGQYVKIAKFKGRFDWHFHADEDELFWVVRGANGDGVARSRQASRSRERGRNPGRAQKY
jgi:hypothetical protein